MAATKAKHSKNYREIFGYFLRLGLLGFGGPMAVMASLRRDLVEQRKWIDHERFDRAFALIKALPGPVATQLAIYMGQARGGRIGGLIAGFMLILPAFLMMIALAAFYTSIESLKWTESVMLGMQATAVGVILESIWKLAQPYRGERAFWIAAIAGAFITVWKPALEPAAIIGAGVLGMMIMRLNPSIVKMILPPMFAAGLGVPTITGQLLGVALKAGAFTFGTGLAIVPMLANDVVHDFRWLTERQFLDALAFGQITPGPVVISITFIGYKVAGLWGAVVATAGVFAPAFLNILTWFPIAERKIGKSPYTRQFILWALGAVVGSIAVSLLRLAMNQPATSSSATHIMFAVLALAAFVAALRTKLAVWVIIPAGGIIGALVGLVSG